MVWHLPLSQVTWPASVSIVGWKSQVPWAVLRWVLPMTVSMTFFPTDIHYSYNIDTFESYSPGSLVKVPLQTLILRCCFHNFHRISVVTLDIFQLKKNSCYYIKQTAWKISLHFNCNCIKYMYLLTKNRGRYAKVKMFWNWKLLCVCICTCLIHDMSVFYILLNWSLYSFIYSERVLEEETQLLPFPLSPFKTFSYAALTPSSH